MKYLNLKTVTTGLVALLVCLAVFANQAVAAAGPPPARVVVAKSGGNYTTITAALNAITPTEANPYVIEVWPGVYTEPSTVVLKSYVHLKGSGRDVITVKALGGNFIILANDVTNVAISGLTITGGNVTGMGGIGFSNSPNVSSSITISENTIRIIW